MKIAIILNGISRKKKKFYQHFLPALDQKFSVDVFETRFSGHATQLAGEAVTKGFDAIISAGGDGTLNQVVNGMLKTQVARLPMLGIVPLGSGNDFAAMMGASANPAQLIQQLEANKSTPVDIGKILCRDKEGNPVEKYFMNVCSVGMGPDTVKKLERSPRWLGPDIRYYTTIVNTFLTHKPEELEVRTADWTWNGKARVLAIANGKSFGNKIYIAPNAKPDDGIFSTFIATDMPLIKFLLFLQTLKGKKKVKDGSILYSTATELEITSPHETMIEAEGEMAGYLPAKVVVKQGRINFLA